MTELIFFFFRLARLRQPPQDLPASVPLLVLTIVVSVTIGVVRGSRVFGDAGTALLANLVDLAVTASLLWLLLSVNGKQARLLQTCTAFFGLGAFFGLVLLLPQWLAMATTADQLAGLLMLLILIWAHVAFGHVLRHALDQSLGAGIALAVGVSAAAYVVVGKLFLMPVAGVDP